MLLTLDIHVGSIAPITAVVDGGERRVVEIERASIGSDLFGHGIDLIYRRVPVGGFVVIVVVISPAHKHHSGVIALLNCRDLTLVALKIGGRVGSEILSIVRCGLTAT